MIKLLSALGKRYYSTIIVLILGISCAYSQCSHCTTTYAGGTGATIMINSGQTVCINSGVTCSGPVFLNGGTLCNSGTVTDLRLDAGNGIINNYGTIYDNESNISFTGNIAIYSTSQINFNTVSINMNAADSLYINNSGKLTFFNDLSIASKKLSINNSGTFNVNNDLSVSDAALWVYNTSSANFNISGSINLANTGNKTISNYGIVNIYNALNIGGDGRSMTTVLIDNYSNLYTVNNLECTMANGIFHLNNNEPLSPGIEIDGDLILNESTNSTLNNGVLIVQGNILTYFGTITNNNSLYGNNDINVDGTFINNGETDIGSNLVITSTAKATNNSLITVGNNFQNTGKFRLGNSALLITNNYYNTGSDTLIGAPVLSSDSLHYARIWINSYSQNTGYITGKVLVYDGSLATNTANVGYGFDAIANPIRIQTGVVFITHVLTPISASEDQGKHDLFFKMSASASTYNIACGMDNNVNLYASLTVPYNAGGYTLYYQVPSANFTWQPGSLIGQSQTVYPSTTTTYIATALYQGINYTASVTVNVATLIVTIASTDIYFAIPDVVTLNPTVSGGSGPYTYLWLPNNYFVNGTTNTQLNPQVSPPVSLAYNLTATDANGCHGTTTVNVIAEPYAHLNKIPDGGYYNLFNNKLLFKYNGQYAATNLVCNVYDKTNILVTSGAFSSLVVNSGDNRYYYNANTLGVGYYTMEIVNEKKEKLFLRFKR